MGSGTKTTTQNTASEPWAAAQPALKTGLADAQNLYKTGVGSQAYTGSTVIPYAQQTTQGMGAIQNAAMANMNGTGASGLYQGVINNGGFNAPQQSAMNQFGQIGQNAQGPSYSEQNLMGIAQGDMLNRQDPNFERALSAASDSAANQINMGASASGRYGSGIHQGAVAKQIGDYEAGQRVNQYNTERGNQMNANSMIDSQRMAGLGLGMNAAQNQFNAGQQGFSNIGSAYEGMKAPAQDIMGVGSMYEDLASRMKNDELRIFQEQQNAPWDQLGRLNAVAGGMGSMGGTNNTTSQAPGQSPFATGLGYASSLGGLLGSFKGF
jgi:hypothetical protein